MERVIELAAQSEVSEDQTAAPPETLCDFYGSVLPWGGGRLALFLGQSRRHVWADSITELTDATLARGSATDTYFALAAFGADGNRKADNATAIRSLFFDIDAGPEKVAKHGDRVYATQAEAKQALINWCMATGLRPSRVVGSGGGGLHAYFGPDQDYTVAEWRPVAEALRDMALAQGLRIDACVTADASRVLRPPGTTHPSGKTVKTILATDQVYTLEQMAAITSAYAPAVATRRVSTNVDVLQAPSGPPKSLAKIIDQCAAMAQAVATCGGTYSTWRSMLGITKFTDEGREAAHRHSRNHPDYSEAETDRKFDGWEGGPTTCDTFAADLPEACAGCAYRGKIKSPFTLGLPSPPTSASPVDEAQASDLALAARWAQQYSGAAKFDHARDAWMAYREGAWRYAGRGEHVELFKQLAADLMSDSAAHMRRGEGDHAKRLLAFAARAHSAAGARAALTFAQSDPLLAEVTPFSRTLFQPERRSSRCQIPSRRIRRSFVSRWSSWRKPVVA